ncbi:hypothetical protein M422DRAFT_223858 [Sphaerobolus stellatus SS14]|nr:hypothetical protein M422DRAFT_223858 [Sphaerobolus stellatus SS14]
MDVAALRAELNKIPPVTRFVAGSMLAVTLPVMVGVVSVYKVLYHRDFVLRQFEIWRVWSTFFYGGSGINFLFDFVMLYRTSDGLESQHFLHRSADYAWQLLLASLGLLALNQPLGTHILHRPFLMMLIYLSSRLSPDALFSLFGLATIQARWWPYVMLVMDGMMGGQAALAQSLTGLITGHAWYLLFWRDQAARQSALGRAPQWLQRLMPYTSAAPGTTGPQPRGFGAAPRIPVTNPQTAAAAAPRGYSWGTGNRLGGE